MITQVVQSVLARQTSSPIFGMIRAEIQSDAARLVSIHPIAILNGTVRGSASATFASAPKSRAEQQSAYKKHPADICDAASRRVDPCHSRRA